MLLHRLLLFNIAMNKVSQLTSHLRLLCTTCFCASTLMVAAQTATVAVFSLNDFHGGFVADKNKDIPGAENVLATLDSLKRVYPFHVTVSAGDNFGGSYFYKATKGTVLPRFFADCGITLSAVGNHEFDDGTEELAKKWSDSPLRPADWTLRYVCANVRDASGKIPNYMQPFATQEIVLSPTKKINVAFVGLLTSSTPSQVSKRRIEGLSFDGKYNVVLDSVKHLPGYDAVEKANLRLLLLHVGTQMEKGQAVWDDRNAKDMLAFNDPTFHALLTGHSHSPVCGHLNANKYPVVQGKWHGEYISVIKAVVDTVTMQVLSVEPMLVPTRTDLRLTPRQQELANIIAQQLQTTKMAGAPLSEVLTVAKDTYIHDRDDKHQQTRVGTLVCEAYDVAARKALGLKEAMIVGTSHFGSIRAGFTKGEVRVLDIGESLPFANAIRVFRVTGKQVYELVDFGFRNQRFGYIQTSRLTFKKGKDGSIKSIYYTSPEGRCKKLKAKDVVYLAVDEFQANGGDGYDPQFFPKSQEVKGLSMPTTTEAFIAYLRTLPSI